MSTEACYIITMKENIDKTFVMKEIKIMFVFRFSYTHYTCRPPTCIKKTHWALNLFLEHDGIIVSTAITLCSIEAKNI